MLDYLVQCTVNSPKFQTKLIHSFSMDIVAPGAGNVQQSVKYFMTEYLSGSYRDWHRRTVEKEVHK